MSGPTNQLKTVLHLMKVCGVCKQQETKCSEPVMNTWCHHEDSERLIFSVKGYSSRLLQSSSGVPACWAGRVEHRGIYWQWLRWASQQCASAWRWIGPCRNTTTHLALYLRRWRCDLFGEQSSSRLDAQHVSEAFRCGAARVHHSVLQRLLFGPGHLNAPVVLSVTAAGWSVSLSFGFIFIVWADAGQMQHGVTILHQLGLVGTQTQACFISSKAGFISSPCNASLV